MLVGGAWELVPDEQTDAALILCGWCGDMVLPEDTPVFVTAKCFGSTDKYEGRMVLVPLSTGEQILGSVGTPDSQLRKDGKDIAFMCCKDACARKLRDALEDEMRTLAESAAGTPS